MRRQCIVVLLAYFPFVGVIPSIFAQHISTDTLFISSAVKHARLQNNEATYKEWGLYTGSQYLSRVIAGETFPYFLTYSWSKGEIEYQGEWYYDVSMLYDIHRDKLIIQHYSGASIELVNQKISAFNFQGRHFKRFPDSESGQFKEGFYEVLYDGETKLLAKRAKLKLNQGLQVNIEYKPEDILFLVKDQSFFRVRSKKSVLLVLSDQKQNLKKYIRTSGLNFNHDREGAIRKVLQFYDLQMQ